MGEGVLETGEATVREEGARPSASPVGLLRRLGRRFARLRRDCSGEFAQAVARLFIHAACWSYILFLLPIFSGTALSFNGAVAVAVFGSVGAIAITIHMLAAPRPLVARRVIWIVHDLVPLSGILYLDGQHTSPLIIFYLWVIFGNGFRYGTRYLAFSAILSASLFSIVIAASPYWRANFLDALGVLVSTIVLPLFAVDLIRRLREAKQQAEVANASKSKFIAMMSHEIRTPLNAVLGLADILDGTRLNVEQRRMVGSIKDSSFSLLDIVNDVLEFAKIEAGRLHADSGRVDVYDMMASLESMMFPLARNKGLNFNVFIDPSAPRYLNCDVRHLKKILVNLLGNAVKYTDEGEVVVVARLSSGDAERCLEIEVRDTGIGIPETELEKIFERFSQAQNEEQNVRGGAGLGLAISRELAKLIDAEIGVASAVGMGSVFTLRLPSAMIESSLDADVAATSEVYVLDRDGAGARLVEAIAGFATAPRLVADLDDLAARASAMQSRPIVMCPLSGGLITELRNKRADGDFGGYLAPIVVFVAEGDGDIDVARRLDAASVSACIVTAEAARREWGAAFGFALSLRRSGDADQAESVALEHARKLRVLIAEDNEMNRQVAARMVRELGHDAVLAENGERALDALARDTIDVVFMDINMPVINGVEAAQLYRFTEAEDKRIPILALTADVTEKQRQKCLKSGMDDVIHKPVTIKGLEAALVAHTGAGRFAGESASVVEPANDRARSANDAEEASGDTIDIGRLDELKQLDDSGEFLDKIARAFIDDATELINEAKASIQDGDLERLQQARHAIRSSALNLGAGRIVDLCLQARTIEDAELERRGGDFVDDLEVELTGVRQALAAQLGRPL